MKRFLQNAAVLATAMTLGSAVWAAPAPKTADAPVADRFAAGDAYFLKRGDEQAALGALEAYRAALKETPNDPQAGWRVAMACYFVGLRIEKDPEKKLKMFEEGKNAGLGAASRYPKCVACHFWGAITLALYGDAVGAVKMLFALKEIEEHLNHVIDQDPAYAHGGAYRLLGLIEQKLPGILGGNDDEAKQYFKKAIKVAPDEPLNYLFLAELEDDAFDNRKAALAAVREGIAVKNLAPDRLESHESQEELKKLLAKWEKKKKDDEK